MKKGTQVMLEVVRGHTPRLTEIFAAYTNAETLRFARTRSTIKLGALGTTLMSRSEAVSRERRASRAAGTLTREDPAL